MKQIIIVWLAIVLIIVCLLFPPYGYDKIGSDSETTPWITEPWQYVANRFVFAPNFDQLRKEGVQVGRLDIGWHAVAVECAIIVLVAGGAIFTLNRLERRKS